MTQRKKNNIIIGSLCAVVLLMAVGYAAFSSILNIKGTTNIASNWNILITNVESKNIVGSASNAEEPSWENLTATFKTNLVSPGDSIEYDITVSNQGTLNAVLKKITVSDTNNPAIKFTSSGLEEGSELNAGDSAILTVKVEYDNAVTEQPENTEGTFTVTLDYAQADGSGTVKPSEPITSSDLIATAVTSGDGLYLDTTETGRYIYKGTDPNNYITFNNELWRIMSVENDSTIKIIRNESIGNMVWDTSNSNNWARPATLNTYLNSEYLETINEGSMYIVNHDFNVGTPGGISDTEDITTDVGQEAQITWNGKIGLMTITEILKTTTDTGCTSLNVANNNYSKSVCSNNNWMWPKSGYSWPISSNSDNPRSVWYANSGGYLSNGPAKDTYSGVMPVLYLTSEITLDGEGTSSNPYTIVS